MRGVTRGDVRGKVAGRRAYHEPMRSAVIALALLALPALPACASFQADFQRRFTPGVTEGSHVHAWQAASFAYAFLDGHEHEWDARLAAAERDLPPLFAALGKSSYRAEFEVVPHEARGPDLTYEYYGVNLVLVPRSGKGERFAIPGDPGTDPDAYQRALAPAAKKSGIPEDVLKKGHFALFALATMSGSLNGTEDSMRRYAFGLLVLREKLTRKMPNVDYLAPQRTPDKSLEDVALALRVVADEHAATSRLRGEVLAVLALAREGDVPEARDALAEQIAASRKNANEWRATHHRPTQDEYGVAMKAFELPTPDAMLEVLDKDGYLSAAVAIARGAASADVGATIQGFGKLAPPNSSLRIASEGTAAALHGDVQATAKAILALAEKDEDLAPTVARVRSVERAVASARHAASDVGAAANDVRGAVADPKRAVQQAIKR
jgi:hypothetical protein